MDRVGARKSRQRKYILRAVCRWRSKFYRSAPVPTHGDEPRQVRVRRRPTWSWSTVTLHLYIDLPWVTSSRCRTSPAALHECLI